MSDTYICPRCNGELEVIFEDHRGKTVPVLSAYSQPSYVCAVTCHHCDWTCSEYFKKSDFDTIYSQEAVKHYVYRKFCEQVPKRPTRRYKPISDTVTAVQWTGRNYEEMRMFLGSTSRTNNLVQILSRGEYVIRHVDGTFSILPEKDFKEKYEEVLK